MIVYCGLRHFYIQHFEPPEQDAYYILTHNKEVWDFSPELKKHGVTLGVKPKTVFQLERPVLTLPLELDEYAPFSRSWYDFSRLYTKELEPEYPHAWYLRFKQKSILEQFLFDFAKKAEQEGAGAIFGVGKSKLVAKLAAHNLPPGQNIIPPEKTEEFLLRVPLNRLPLPEVNILQNLGLHTIGELGRLPFVELVNWLGKRAELFQKLGQGEDLNPFSSLAVVELNWSLDCAVLNGFLEPLAHSELYPYLRAGLQELAGSLREQGQVAGLLKLEARTEGGEFVQSQRRFKGASDEWKVFERAVHSLLPPKRIARLGIRLAELKDAPVIQLNMFTQPAEAKVIPLPPRFPAQVGVELPRREKFLQIWKEYLLNEQAN